jgi:transcriptional regulator with XRE-family HTH domain
MRAITGIPGGNIGAQIENTRRNRKMTITAVCQRADIAQMTYRKIVAGVVEPNYPTVAAIFQAMGIEIGITVVSGDTASIVDLDQAAGQVMAKAPRVYT